jgi:HEAT repeat protein
MSGIENGWQMDSTFKRDLDQIVNRLDPETRAGTEQERDRLLAAGVDSQAALAALAQDPEADRSLRTIACWFLARLASPGALDALLACLYDTAPSLRAEAARGLGTLGDSQAIEALLAAMADDESAQVRLAATYALGLLDDSRKIEPLIAKLQDQQEEAAIRGMAAEVLGNSYDSRAIAPLLEALADPEVEVRFWAVFALGELGAEAALPALYRLAASDEAVLPGWWSVQQEARSSIALIENQPNDEEDDTAQDQT